MSTRHHLHPLWNYRHLLSLCLAAMISMLLSSCSEEETNFDLALEESASSVVARVGDQNILSSDVEAELRMMPASLQTFARTPEAQRRVEEILIRRAVLSQQAVAQGLDVKPDVYASIRKARDDILIEAIKTQYLNNLPIPEEKELSAYYQQQQDAFTTPEQIHARHILLRSKKEAQHVADLLKKKGADFAALAIEYSRDDSNKNRGGDLNWFPRGLMAKNFEEAAFALKKEGDISAPVKTDSGWHIIQMKGKRSASLQSFDQARIEIIHTIQHQNFEAWIESLMKDADIQRNHSEAVGEIQPIERLNPAQSPPKKNGNKPENPEK